MLKLLKYFCKRLKSVIVSEELADGKWTVIVPKVPAAPLSLMANDSLCLVSPRRAHCSRRQEVAPDVKAASRRSDTELEPPDGSPDQTIAALASPDTKASEATLRSNTKCRQSEGNMISQWAQRRLCWLGTKYPHTRKKKGIWGRNNLKININM